MGKELRKQVYDKYDGRCAYCGCELGEKMQVDHIQPVFRCYLGAEERTKASETIEKLNPACGRCNRYKATLNLEEFREEISKQVYRARNKSWNFRMAEDFGLITPTNVPVIFWFEKDRGKR